MPTAFVLGAGLGTRLRPITDRVPKPLVAVAHQPLLTWAFRHLSADLGIDRFVVNTHHLPEAYDRAFPDRLWEGCPLVFRHEPTLLDTGGGLANVRDLLPAGETIALYNGDILCDAPLAPLAAAHADSGADVTLMLREDGALRNVVCAADACLPTGERMGKILDIRGLRGQSGPLFQFSGIALLGPRFVQALPSDGGIFSLIPWLTTSIDHGMRVDGVVIEAGWWSDLGTPTAVLAAHRHLAGGGFPRYGAVPMPRVHPEAVVAPGTLDTDSWVGPGAVVPEGCRVERGVILPGVRLDPGEIVIDTLRG